VFKQVPDTEALIKVKADGSGIEEGGIKWVMNPYDEYGVEEALKLKEKNCGEVTNRFHGPRAGDGDNPTALAMGVRRVFTSPLIRRMSTIRQPLWQPPSKRSIPTSSSADSGRSMTIRSGWIHPGGSCSDCGGYPCYQA
jgi:hypothetical protein